MKNNKNIKRQMQNTLLIKRKVRYDQEVFCLFFNEIFPNHNDFLNFLHTSGKDSMVKHAKKIVDRLLFDTPWSGAENLYRNLLNLETRVLTEGNETYIPQNHTVHSIHLYILGIYFYFNFSVFHETLSKYFKNLDKTVSKQLYDCYTKDQRSFLIFLDAWKCFSLLHDVAYPYEALIDSKGNMKKQISVYLEPYENLNAYMQYNYTMKFFAYMILINIIIRDSKNQLEDYAETNMSKFKWVNDEGKDKKKNEILDDLKDFYKLEYIDDYSDFEMMTSWLKVEKKAIILRGQEGIEDIIIVWDDMNSSYVFVNCESIGKKINIEKVKKIIRENNQKKIFYIEFYIQGDLSCLFENKLSNLNLFAREKELDELCAAVRKDISIELSSLSQNWKLQDIIFLIVQYIGKWCVVDKILEEGSFSIEANKFLAENFDLFTRAIRHNMEKAAREAVVQEGAFFSYSDMENVLNKICHLNMENVCKEIKKEYYEEKQETAHLGLSCVEAFRNIFNDLWTQQINIQKKNYVKGIEMDDLIPFRNASPVSNRLKCLLEKENFKMKEDVDSFERLFKYKTDYYKFDHGIMAGRIALEALHYIWENTELWEEKGVDILWEYRNMPLEGITEAVYAIFVHNIYVNEYQKTSGILPEHDLLINPFTYFGMFCDNLQVWDRDKSINHGNMEWKGNTLYGEDISINLKEKTIEIKCRATDIRTSFFKLKEGMKEYLNSADKLIELNLFE